MTNEEIEVALKHQREWVKGMLKVQRLTSMNIGMIWSVIADMKNELGYLMVQLEEKENE